MKEFPLVFDATSKLTAKEAAFIFGGVAAIVGLAYLTKALIDAFSKADNIPTADQQRASAEAFMRAAKANGAKEVEIIMENAAAAGFRSSAKGANFESKAQKGNKTYFKVKLP